MASRGGHLCWLVISLCLLPRLTFQYNMECGDQGDRRPRVSIDPRAYPSLESICEYGAGCQCTRSGFVACLGSPTHSVHMIYTAYQEYCIDHCACAVQSEDLKVPQYYSNRKSQDKENSRPKEPIPAHVCSGTCSEVARSCSWAYTGECMCTAASAPDPWGLFASHGCVAVIKSSLGGRDVASHESSPKKTNSSVAVPLQINAIVKGSEGYFNASTGVQIACPCNSTCVSYGCCGSNGMTQAPDDKCLGKLDIASDSGGAEESEDFD